MEPSQEPIQILDVCRRMHDRALEQAKRYPLWSTMHAEHLKDAAQCARFYQHIVSVNGFDPDTLPAAEICD